MENINAYILIIAASLIIIASYLFSVIGKKTNIPSVLLLLTLGIILHEVLLGLYGEVIDFMSVLELLGIVGLIMIVLEAALDLELSRDKKSLLLKSFFVALLTLGISACSISFIFKGLLNTDYLNALIYAIPLSIMSSAIVIPSVANLQKDKKEFMIYESTFSDILGIMFFYLLLQSSDADSGFEVGMGISINLILTLLLSVIASYGLVFIFHKLQSNIRLFVLIAVLILMYALGKMLHLSSLLIILAFGLILNNPGIFFKGKIKKYIHDESIKKVYDQLRLVTIETSFVVRTFFFVIFGLSISIGTLFNWQVLTVSMLVLAFLYGIRWIVLRFFIKKDFLLEWLIAPRGLITVLLYFNIPPEFAIAEFRSEILLAIIIVSSIIMAIGMIKYRKQSHEKNVNIDQNAKGVNAITAVDSINK